MYLMVFLVIIYIYLMLNLSVGAFYLCRPLMK